MNKQQGGSDSAMRNEEDEDKWIVCRRGVKAPVANPNETESLQGNDAQDRSAPVMKWCPVSWYCKCDGGEKCLQGLKPRRPTCPVTSYCDCGGETVCLLGLEPRKRSRKRS